MHFSHINTLRLTKNIRPSHANKHVACLAVYIRLRRTLQPPLRGRSCPTSHFQQEVITTARWTYQMKSLTLKLTFACASQHPGQQAANSKALWSQKRAGSLCCTLYMAKSCYQWMLGGIPDIPWKHGDQNKGKTQAIHVEWVNYDLTTK